MYYWYVFVLILIVLKTPNAASDNFSIASNCESAAEATSAIEAYNPDTGFDLPGAVLLK